jgi:hypothetical protein
MDNDYTLHLLHRQQYQQPGRFRRKKVPLGRPALGTEFKRICVSDAVFPRVKDGDDLPTYRA